MILCLIKMLDILRYKSSLKGEWDNLIRCSRNGTFLFFRDYMDYHSDRFRDNSFLILKKNKVVGVIPGNIEKDVFYTHQGLTYGGLITSSSVSSDDTIEIFGLLEGELKCINIKTVVYKPIPLIYHRIPSQEDIYVLFLRKAEKIGCNLSSAIFRDSKLGFAESRKSGLRKSQREGIEVTESTDFAYFWSMLENNLSQRYELKPTHSLDEIMFLKDRFPQCIKLFVAKRHDLIIAGAVLYIMTNVVHIQYIAANSEGKAAGALDLLFDVLINKSFKDIPFFDFGHSNEHMGNFLNKNLIFQKEGFGGRGITYEIYKYDLWQDDHQ